MTVPRSFTTLRLPNGEILPRSFKFAELNVTPGFYSQRALVLSVDGDGTLQQVEGPLDLRFAVGYTCDETLYYKERADGVRADSPFDQGNREFSLQNFLDALNLNFSTLIPAGFSRSPAFVDWVDLNWYENESDHDEHQDSHNSAERTGLLAVDPVQLVPFNCSEYYDAEETQLGTFEDSLPLSVRNLSGVNNYRFPVEAVTATEDGRSMLRSLRLRIHVAPNATVSFSSKENLRNLGFTAEMQKGRGQKNRFHLENLGSGSNYRVFTAASPPATVFGAAVGRIYCKPTTDTHIFAEASVTFEPGTFSENANVLDIVTAAMDGPLKMAGVSFPQLKFNFFGSKFFFEYPTNDRLSLFVECDDRLAERLGYGPVTKITRHMVSSVIRDGKSTVEAETLCKALAFDAGMCIVTLNEASSNDTYGVDDFNMTTLWPTSSGTFRMSEKFSRSAFLPTVGGGGRQPSMIEMVFTVSTLKKKSERVPLCWPVSFCVEGTLEGNV